MQKQINNLGDYEKALLELEKLFDALPNTKKGEDLIELVNLIQDWEDKECPSGEWK